MGAVSILIRVNNLSIASIRGGIDCNPWVKGCRQEVGHNIDIPFDNEGKGIDI